MAVRIQLRRDTASNWSTNNPVLRPGEVGVETDTLKIKIGPSVVSPAIGTAWNSITAYANVVPSSLNQTLTDYIQFGDIGTESGPVGLNADLNAIIPGDAIIFEGATDNTYETTLVVTDPTADRTITLPNATGTVALTTDITTAVDAITTDVIEEGSTNLYFTDDRAQDAVATALANGTHTNITVGYNDGSNAISLTGAVTYTDENAQDAIGNAVGTGLSYNDSTGAISVDTTTIQARVADVSDTEIGYLNGVTSAIQTQLDNKLALSGGTLTGALTLSGAPSSPLHAATKAYVDNTTAGLNFHSPAHVATTANLTATYSNGTDGVGATLTGSGAFPQIDGHTAAEQERVLVKNQSTALQNGLYVLTDDGDPSGSWVLTRATDADNSPAGEIAYGDFCFVQNGGQAGYGFIVNTTGTITIGTTSINYIQFSAGQVVTAGNGLTEPVAGTLAIDTTITADLSTAQTFTNKTLTSPNINEAVALTATATELNILDGATLSTTELNYVDGVTSAIQTQIDSKLSTSTASSTYQPIVSGVSDTEIGYLDGVTSSIQTQLDSKIAKSLVDAKGDILVGSADNTVTRLGVGTNGYLLTANSSATNGVEWAAAPVSLPAQTGESGKYLTTDGTTASWGTLVVPISTSTGTVSSNTIATIDTTALAAFTSIEYMVSLKQGTKIRTSKVIVQNNGSSVDMTEFAITETGGVISGVVVSAAVSSTNAVLQLTVTDAASTNVTVKLSKVAL